MRALRSLPILVAAAVASVPAPAPAGPLAPISSAGTPLGSDTGFFAKDK